MTDVDYRSMYLKVRDELAELQQREWVGLDEHDFDVLFLNEDGIRFAKYIEAKLKEKNDRQDQR